MKKVAIATLIIIAINVIHNHITGDKRINGLDCLIAYPLIIHLLIGCAKDYKQLHQKHKGE